MQGIHPGQADTVSGSNIDLLGACLGLGSGMHQDERSEEINKAEYG